jgi:hypothetical protein
MGASDESGRPALVLVEAKAHISELSTAGKSASKRESPDQQKRSDENHEQIGTAIAQAMATLCKLVPGISLTRDKSYQFANRIAFAWKLASLGVPVGLIYLGFIGDLGISHGDDCFRTSKHWRDAFRTHTAEHFPSGMLERRIDCGDASFWLLVREIQVLRQSPMLGQRKPLASQL